MPDHVFGGYSTIGNDLFARYDAVYDHALPQRVQDIQQAKFLLKQAGQEGLTVMLTTGGGSFTDIDLAQVRQQDAKAAAVTVKLQNLSADALNVGYLKWRFAQTFWYGTLTRWIRLPGGVARLKGSIAPRTRSTLHWPPNKEECVPTVPEVPPEIKLFREQALAFIREYVHPLEQQIARTGSFDGYEELKRRAEKELTLPAQYRRGAEAGADASMVVQVAVEELAGHATNGLGFVIPTVRGREVLDGIATPLQKERYVLPVMRGEARTAWAITEPQSAGSDVAGIQTTATRDGSAWVLNGEKWFVTGGDRATFFLVLAWAGQEQALFIVDGGTPGLEIVRRPEFMHDPYPSGHVELKLENCHVPDENRVPAGDGGTRRWLAVERLMIAARCCGAAERLIDETTEWAKERVSFGQPIIDYQGVQFPLSDSAVELLTARLLTYHAAEACDTHPDEKIVHGKISMAKLYASEMANRIADRCLQIFGGRGYMTENVANRYFRELRVDRIWEGTSEIQRVIIARGLIKRGHAPYTALWPPASE